MSAAPLSVQSNAISHTDTTTILVCTFAQTLGLRVNIGWSLYNSVLFGVTLLQLYFSIWVTNVSLIILSYLIILNNLVVIWPSPIWLARICDLLQNSTYYLSFSLQYIKRVNSTNFVKGWCISDQGTLSVMTVNRSREILVGWSDKVSQRFVLVLALILLI